MTLLNLLNIETGASAETLERIIASAPRRYKVYEIPKKSGGTRIIAHPARELKRLQRIILRHILDHLTVSEVATAYVRGRGILYNAKIHAGQRWILKLDFENFFHSITPRDWDRLVRSEDILRGYISDSKSFHQLLFWGAGGRQPTCLSIGAPTSPSVSNLVCARLDQWMTDRARRLGLRVTRYADDITVSGQNLAKIEKFEADLSFALANSKGLKLSLNHSKRGLYGPGMRKMVTGLILTNDGSVSLGRERKREISTLIHRFGFNLLDRNEILRAKGLLAFAYSAEPDFVHRMRAKYGIELISRLTKSDGGADFVAFDF